MTPVTDPKILAQLNADQTPPQNSGLGEPVTDPRILAQLNGEMPQKSKSFMDELGYVNESLGKGLRHAISAPAQFVNPFIDSVVGSDLTGSLNRANQERDEEYYKKYPEGGYIGQAISDVGEYLPSMFVGGGLMKGAGAVAAGASKIPAALKGLGGLIGRGAGAGVLTSPLIYDQESKLSPLQKAGIGGITGAIGAPLLGGLGKGTELIGKAASKGKDWLSIALTPSKIAEKNMLGDIANPAEAIAKKAAGERIGVNLRPSEASQSTLAAATEADLGYSKEGAKLLEQQAKIRQAEEKGAISNLLNEITPDSKNVNVSGQTRDIAKQIQEARENAVLSHEGKGIESFMNNLSPGEHADVGTSARKMAKDILQKKRDALSEQASPLYEAAYGETVAPNKLNSLMKKDGTIEKAVQDVLKNPDYRAELQGYAPNSIKVLDLAKRQIDSRISGANQAGDREQVRLLMKAKERLVSETDQYSPTYAKARAIYSEGAKPISALENSTIGRLSQLDDAQLNKATKTLFNPQETNLQILAKARDEIVKENPELWKGIVRSEMERRLDRTNNPLSGENFYKQVFGKSVDYKQFKEAVKGFPELQKEMEALRAQFKNSSHNMKSIRGTDIAKISRMNDSQLKNVSKTIFDPTQTDQMAFSKIRDSFEKADPKVWNNLTRNEIERLMATVKNNRYGSKFYSAVLENDNKFNQFLEATKNNQKVHDKLKDMREVFRSLINTKNAREAYNKRANKLDVGRNAVSMALGMVKKLIAGDYDKAALKVVFSKDWDKSLHKVHQINSKEGRDLGMLNLLRSVGGALPSIVQGLVK